VRPAIEQEFVATGKIRTIYRHFAFLGPESFWAAEASECANDQGKFWEMHDAIYANQQGENQGAFSKENLKRFAQEINLNVTLFNDCLDNGKYAAKVRSDSAAAQAAGIRGTPTFILNGTQVLILSANPEASIARARQLITQELARIP
jgi:protein-disulfide isomerase